MRQLLASGITVEEFIDWLGYYPYKTALRNQAMERAKIEASTRAH